MTHALFAVDSNLALKNPVSATMEVDESISHSSVGASLRNSLGTFVANIGYGGIRGGVMFLNALLLTPVLIRGLGKEQFAVLAFATPFLRYGFNGVFDLGLATALVRFISRDFAAHDHEGINRYFCGALLIYAVAGLSLLVVFWVLSPVMIPWILGLNMSLYAAARTALWRLLWIFGLLLLSNPFFALLMGIQKVHLTHLIGTFSLSCELIGILVLVPFGLTMSRVVLVYAAGAILSTLLSIFLVRRHFPKPGLRLVSVSRSSILDLVHYTRRWSVTVSSTLLPPVIDKLILARFLGLSYVALYEAAAKLVEILKRATQLLLLPLFPLAGAVVPNQSEEETQALYLRVFAANLAFNTGLYLIPAALSFGIMSIWLGPEVSGVAGVVFGILAITQFLLALVFPGVLILAGTGRMGLLVIAGVTAMSLNIFLSPVLTRYLGLHGLLAGTVLSYGGQSLLILIGLQRQKEFALDVGAFLSTAVALAGAAVVPVLALTQLFGQATGGAKLAAFGAVSIALYCLVLLAFGENRKLAALMVAHSRRMFAGRNAGQKSQA